MAVVSSLHVYFTPQHTTNDTASCRAAYVSLGQQLVNENVRGRKSQGK